MTMSVGDGSVDLRRAMKEETYAGSVTSGRVTVEYPAGLSSIAEDLAKKFDTFYPVVKEQLGINWSFDLVLKLVQVDPEASGFRYSIKLSRDRRLVFPMPVIRERPVSYWAPIVAHEVTEASMIAPKARNGLVLDDIFSGSFCLPTGTRWFRDGVSDYAAHLFHGKPPARVYEELNRVGDMLTSWSNCKHQPDWYDAACGLVFEIKNRFGEDAIATMISELSHDSAPDGLGLARAFRRTTGLDLDEFLKSYQTPWAGWTVRDETVDGKNCVKIVAIYPATPAKRRGVAAGDIVASFAGKPVTSAAELAHSLARQRPWEMAPVEVCRGGKLIPMRLKLIPMPPDIRLFLRLSQVGS